MLDIAATLLITGMSLLFAHNGNWGQNYEIYLPRMRKQ